MNKINMGVIYTNPLINPYIKKFISLYSIFGFQHTKK